MAVAEWEFIRNDVRLVLSAYTLSDDALDAAIARLATPTVQTALGSGPRRYVPVGGYWLPGVELLLEDGTAVTPQTGDLRGGIWEFAPSTLAFGARVLVRGRWLNWPALLVEAIDLALAAEAQNFDYGAEDADLKRSQPFRHLLELRDRYERQANAKILPMAVPFVREDIVA